MADPMIPRPATDAAGFLPGVLGLRLDEEYLPLTALAGRADVLDRLVPIGTVRQRDGTLLLRFSPDRVLASGPAPDGPFTAVEIGHGLTRFRLRGVEALHFLGYYTSADLHAAAIRRAGAIRTRLNHHDVALWWPTTRDVNILADRSRAQSFADHLRAVAPDAPDRRG
jgi:sarcosine oxidase gamma subunit